MTPPPKDPKGDPHPGTDEPCPKFRPVAWGRVRVNRAIFSNTLLANTHNCAVATLLLADRAVHSYTAARGEGRQALQGTPRVIFLRG